MSRMKNVVLKKKLEEIFKYSEYSYQQPRDSDCDNQAFLKICKKIGEILKDNF